MHFVMLHGNMSWKWMKKVGFLLNSYWMHCIERMIGRVLLKKIYNK